MTRPFLNIGIRHVSENNQSPMTTYQAIRLLSLKGECIACGKVFEIDENRAKQAAEDDVLTSPCCNFPSVIKRASIK
jgi:hypothetical protein